MTRLATVLVGVGSLALAGCVAYEAKPLDPEAAARELGQRSLTAPGLRDFVQQYAQQPPPEWPPPAWGLTDLSLAAFYFHPDLDVARAEWNVQRSGQRTAAQGPRPALAVGPSFNTSNSMPSPWLLTAVLDLTIETAGKRDAREDRAYALAEAARLHIAAVAWQVRSRVREKLAALYAASEARRLLELQQGIQENNVTRVEQLNAAGAVSAYELTQARVASRQSRLALRDAERQTAEAQVELATAVGLPPEVLEGISFSFDELDADPPQAALSDARTRALMNRADVLGVLAEYAASEADLRREIAGQYPDLHFGPAYEYDQGDNKWGLIFGATLPFFDGNRGPIAEAEARREAVAARFEALQLRVVESVARTVTAYQAALAKRADADAMQTDAQAQLQRTEALVAAGELSEADVVAVRLGTSAASLAYLEASSGVQQALGALEDALQSPLELAPEAWQNAPRAQPPGDEGR